MPPHYLFVCDDLLNLSVLFFFSGTEKYSFLGGNCFNDFQEIWLWLKASDLLLRNLLHGFFHLHLSSNAAAKVNCLLYIFIFI